MIYAILVVLGLCAGSFVNALVWRVHEQATRSKKHGARSTKANRTPHSALRISQKDLSILHGRSMCPHCRHTLAAHDLVPVLSWLILKGKCRYCHKPISWQYPVVELLTAGLFTLSYAQWPYTVYGIRYTVFALWLLLLVGLMALVVYDLRWMLLPNRIIYPLAGLGLVQAIIRVSTSQRPTHALVNEVLAIIIGGGIFYLIYQISAGKWIGGGDVKLGWLLGLIVGTPGKSVLFIFLGALAGSLISVPLLASHRLKRTSVIPFGPFLILGAVITVLWGGHLLDWYNHSLLQPR